MLEFLEQFEYRQTIATWWAALTDPWQFLVASFQPTPEQLSAGLEFYGRIFVVVLAIMLLAVLISGRASIGIKAKMLGNGLIFLATLAATAVVMHFSFWALGGKASLGGTCLAYIYAAGPYQPLLAFVSLMIASAMPVELRPYMLNPLTASKAGTLAAQHPGTDTFTVVLGTLATMLITLWVLILVFRSLSYVQDLGFFRSLAAFVIGIVLVGIVSRAFRPMIVAINELPPQAQDTP